MEQTTKRGLVIGAGISGLVTAKELMEVGINDLTILEKGEDLGGVWRTHCWKTCTLTSSKWVTEFGSLPMPDHYFDYPTPEQMLNYIRTFANTFNLVERIECGITVLAVEKDAAGRYDVIADQKIYRDIDHVVFCTGLVGRPDPLSVEGFEHFQGAISHSSEYQSPAPFANQRVLCLGLGESGFGMSSEVSTVAAQTIVSSTPIASAFRVFPHTHNPLEQMQFWPIGSMIKDYQEVLTFGMSWKYRLPEQFRAFYAQHNFLLKDYPEPWQPEAVVPNRWHGKYWPKPDAMFGDSSGNFTRPEAHSDDVLHLVKIGKIIPKGKVTAFDVTGATFADGSRAEIDAVLVNTGYRPGIRDVALPNGWQYRHLDLYKGCFHPQMPNLAFVGMVRPTIGSIPAMAEMQARLVAQVFAGHLNLPEPETLTALIEQEAEQHAQDCPTLQQRRTNVYFFDRWMEEVADLIGCQPKLWEHLGSWKQLQAFLFGASQPLRYRLKGPGVVSDGYERYAHRVAKVYGNCFGLFVKVSVLIFLVYPHALAIALAAGLIWGLKLSVGWGVAIASLFWILYMKVDLFRFIFAFPPLHLALAFLFNRARHHRSQVPRYEAPMIFQTDGSDTAIVESPSAQLSASHSIGGP